MEIYKLGTEISFKLQPDLKGIIIGIKITGEINYEIGFFEDGCYVSKLFYEYELVINPNSEKMKIGFK